LTFSCDFVERSGANGLAEYEPHLPCAAVEYSGRTVAGTRGNKVVFDIDAVDILQVSTEGLYFGFDLV
jgi:hypothetical protein